jgi:hypothetical protein
MSYTKLSLAIAGLMTMLAVSPDSYSNERLQRLTKKPYQVKATRTTLAANHGYEVLYRDKEGYDTMEVWIIKNDKVYTIKCVREQKDSSSYLPIFKKMTYSLELPNTQPSISNNPVEQSTSHDSADIGNFSTYENSRLGIKMQYPTDWKLYEKEYHPDHPDEKWSQVVGFCLPHEIDSHAELENLVIYVKSLPSQNMSLHTYSDKQISHLRKKFSLFEAAATTFAANPAYKVVYSDNKGYYTMEVWTIKQLTQHEYNIYIIRYTAKLQDYSTYLPLVQKMTDTFEIIS